MQGQKIERKARFYGLVWNINKPTIDELSSEGTVVRSEHSGLATNSIDYLGACVFDSKPVAGFGAFVHLAKAAA